MFITSAVLVFMGCNDNMGDTDNRLASVSTLLEPADGNPLFWNRPHHPVFILNGKHRV